MNAAAKRTMPLGSCWRDFGWPTCGSGLRAC